MKTKKELTKAFFSFANKSIDELTPKQEDFLLECWREEKQK